VGSLQSVLIIPDSHLPDHDPEAMDLALEVGSYLGISAIYFLGDLLDMYSVTLHPKSPEIITFLDDEIQAGCEFLNMIDHEFSGIKKVFIEGNHEFRLSRYITKNAPELFGFIKIADLLEIPERLDWEWVDYGHAQYTQILGSKLYARHEPIGTSAKTTATRAMKSVVFGHTHRIESQEVTSIDGESYRAFSPGWLGDKNKKSFNYVRNHHQWSQGFAIVYVSENGDWWGDTKKING